MKNKLINSAKFYAHTKWDSNDLALIGDEIGGRRELCGYRKKSVQGKGQGDNCVFWAVS